jgi:hypothetical protein
MSKYRIPAPAAPWPYEAWVEDPGYDDRHAANWDEWWYPWESKVGAAYASGDPHTKLYKTWHRNANCSKTPNSTANDGERTHIYVKATSVCRSAMTADAFVPIWLKSAWVARPVHFCRGWCLFHHDVGSQAWTLYGPMPHARVPEADRLRLRRTAPGATTLRSSPVVTNTELVIVPGDTLRGLAFVAASNGSVYCYAAQDGRRIWARDLVSGLRSTPVAVVTLFARDGSYVEFYCVYVNGTYGRLYCLDLTDGSILNFWEEPYGHPLEAIRRLRWWLAPVAPEISCRSYS